MLPNAVKALVVAVLAVALTLALAVEPEMPALLTKKLELAFLEEDVSALRLLPVLLLLK